MAEQTAVPSVPFYKDWKFWLPVSLAVFQLPGSFVAYSTLTTKGPRFSITANVNSIEYPPGTQIKEPAASFVVLSIQNIGDRPAEDLVLRVKNSGTVVLRRVDGTETNNKFVNVIPIGRLGVKESVTCKLWSLEPISATTDTLDVAHSLGSSAIRFPERQVSEWLFFYQTLASVFAGSALTAFLLSIYTQWKSASVLKNAQWAMKIASTLGPRLDILEQTQATTIDRQRRTLDLLKDELGPDEWNRVYPKVAILADKPPIHPAGP